MLNSNTWLIKLRKGFIFKKNFFFYKSFLLNLNIYLKENNKIWLKKEIISFIYKYFLNIIYSISIIYFNKENNNIKKVNHIYKICNWLSLL